ncbi:MAG: hypothetical protein ABSD99_00110 [Candidatus Bathyarchaeia archaeon]
MSRLRLYFYAHLVEGVTEKFYELMDWAEVVSMSMKSSKTSICGV